MFKKLLLLFFSIFIGIMLLFAGNIWLTSGSGQTLTLLPPKTQFSIEKPPVDALIGKISALSGNVSWQSRTAQFATLINSPILVQQGEEVDTQGNGKATVEFNQAVQISIFPNTQINFIQTLPENLVIEQKQGTASYFRKGTKVPVSVRGLDLLININLGNSTVSVDKNKSIVTLVVNAGSSTVAFTNTQNSSNVISIKSKGKFIFNNNTKTYKLL